MTCDHIGFFTKNAEKLVEFYTGVLEFVVTQESVLTGSIVNAIFGLESDCRFIKLVKGDFMVELFEPLSPDIRERISKVAGLNHWGYCVDNREDFVKRLRTKNVPVIKIERNGRSVYFMTDPDENRIEIRDCHT
ncbi:VOC family protein [candidate division WOR-3 bacterium]|nr:VOC family protein [candidate division WOR-3 bacterium]